MTSLTRFVVRWPRHTLAAWLLATVALTVIGLPLADHLKPARLILPGTSAATWDELRQGRFGDDTIVLLTGPPAALDAQGPGITARLARVTGTPVVSAWSGLGAQDRHLRPTPRLGLLVADLAPDQHTITDERAQAFADAVHAVVRAPLTATITGPAPMSAAITHETLDAASAAEKIALPLLLLVLLLVFRSPVAALIPLLVAGATVLSGRGVLVLLTSFLRVDSLAAVLLSMIGLALGVDYSLLIVTRFREALGEGHAPPQAATLAAHTAGRTASFAGVTLAAILGITLLLAPPGALVSAVGGALVATALSVVGALVATPALLVLLAHRTGALAPQRDGWIAAVVGRVLSRPALAAACAAVPLLAASAGVLALQTLPPDPRSLPPDSAGGTAFRAARAAGIGLGFELVLHREQGAVTEAGRFRAEQRLERRLAVLPSVKGVAGPGPLGTAFQRETTRQLDDLQRGLASARAGLRRLRADLTAGSDGADRLSDGGAQASAGATKLAGGAGQAADGAHQVATGTVAARRDLATFSSGLAQARRGARALDDGAGRLTAAAGQLRTAANTLAGGLRDGLVAGADRLASGLDDGSSGLKALQEPAVLAAERASSALTELRKMTVGLVDPRYASTIKDLATAVGALTGRNPETGAGVRDGYSGLPDALDQAATATAQGAAGARQLADGARKALRGARQLRDGAATLRSSLARLDRGAAALAAGLDQLTRGADGASGGLDALGAGSAQLDAGLVQLRDRTGDLAAALTRLQAGQARLARQTRAARSTLRTDPFAAAGDTAPALLKSGFAVVAAVDSSDIRRRAAGRYVLDVDHGGATARILVATDLEAGDDRTSVVLHRIQELAGAYAARTGEQVGVGGIATTLEQFDEGTTERLPLIMLGVVLVTFLVLVAVLRSVLLPLLAVSLNVLTVLATFGVLSLLFVGDDPLLGRTGALDIIGVCTIFAITFALSIDYQVFLLARMREGFVMTQDPVEAIRFGISHTARIVTGAALIMVGVFAAFATTDIASVQQFGVGLGFAILADATLVRLVLLPAVMRLAGGSTWWLPDRLERRLPELDVEGVGYVRTQSQLATRAAEVW